MSKMRTLDLNKLKTKKAAIVLLASLIGLSSFSFVIAKADAQPVGRDEFHSTTRPTPPPVHKEPAPGEPGYENPLGKQGALAMMSNPNDPQVRWFEDFDMKCVTWSKTGAEATILGRPLNQEVERVQQWTDTAQKVILKYRMLAQMLHKMQPPADAPDLKAYCDLTADWYSDAADIYDDLIKPRRPCKTMEELEDGLNQIRNRAEALKQTHANLHAMDIDLRKKYHVHMRLAEDALQQFCKPLGHEKPTVGLKPAR